MLFRSPSSQMACQSNTMKLSSRRTKLEDLAALVMGAILREKKP
jgi:hypothetical protein